MVRRKTKPLEEATQEDKKALLSVINNDADTVELRGRKIRIRWMHPSTTDWISTLIVNKGDDRRLLAKCAALIRLNGFWKSHLFYWWVWRWYYYIRQYTSGELTPVFERAFKKKAYQEKEAYLTDMTYLLALDTTDKQMTKEEAERTLQELRSDNVGKSPKSTASTQAPSSSSASPSVE